jgi:class 3 adenylate cyclase
MTVMFLDSRGFTTFAEAHTPDEAFALINELLDLFEPHVHRHGGFITQFTGDGFLALFENADGAVQAAIDQQRAVDRFHSPLLGGVPPRVGIGLHTGSLMLGTVGGKEQLMAGVVADTANLASRIEGMTKAYGARVLCSDVTRSRLADAGRFELREIDRVAARGRREAVGVVEVLDAEADSVRDARRTAAFREGYAAYRSGAFGKALAAFSVCLSDVAATVLAERCRILLAEPPASWDGVWRD